MSHNKQKKLLLIDANSFIHRAFHALPPLENSQGEPTGALYGLTNTLLKVLEDESPDYVAAAFDTPAKTFRKKMFEDYKDHRPEAPEELKRQIQEAEELFEALDIKVVKQDGFEADDILGSLVEKFKQKNGVQTVILTGDLDTLQLVENDNVIVLTPKRGVSQMKQYNEQGVEERFGVGPNRLADYKGLVGDSSDNIPGVPGVGPKTAQKILKKYKSLEEACENINEDEKDSRIRKLANNKDQALMSKKLAKIKKDLSLKVGLEDLCFEVGVSEKAIEYLREMEFESIVERIIRNKQGDLLGGSDIDTDDAVFITNPENAVANNKGVFETKKTKVAYHWKPIIRKLQDEGLDWEGPIFDVKIAAWLCDPDRNDLPLESLKEKYAEGKNHEDALRQLYTHFSQEIKNYGLEKVFNEIEIPLIEVLAEMERWGIKVSPDTLKSVQKKAESELDKVESQIFEKAGRKFNINSPKQVGEVLFENLDIKKGKSKTSTGQYKTSEDVLQEIKEEHPVVPLVLKHREYSKALSTYIRPLLELAQKDGRVHTTFLQTGTGTGRLSSRNPNLQNIPKQSRWANDIRSSFVAEEGFSLVSFDYSQLELRIFAHVSKDPNLTRAFEDGKDIHSLTASKVLDVPLDKVNKEQRRLAKTLNFGIVYGMGARAFSKQSGLDLEESKSFIEKYFEDFSKVKKWQNKTKKEFRAQEYILNENGRRRWLKSSGYYERAAINMPVQSLGADIMKLGMIRAHKLVEEEGWRGKARLILSIHDELLMEVKNDILEEVVEEVEPLLEEAYSLSVPLEIETKVGKSWGDMKKY